MPRPYRKRDPQGNPDRLLSAVGKLLREKGHQALSTQQIAYVSGVGKQYISRFFGNRINLIKTYLLNNDFWLPRLKHAREQTAPQGEEILRLFISMMQSQFRYFLQNKELRKFILWQETDTSALMRSINEMREEAGNKVIALAHEHFRHSGIDIHWVIALTLTGGYFCGLQSDTDNGTVCGRTCQDPQQVEDAVQTFGIILESVWKAAEYSRQGTLDKSFYQSLLHKAEGSKVLRYFETGQEPKNMTK